MYITSSPVNQHLPAEKDDSSKRLIPQQSNLARKSNIEPRYCFECGNSSDPLSKCNFGLHFKDGGQLKTTQYYCTSTCTNIHIASHIHMI